MHRNLIGGAALLLTGFLVGILVSKAPMAFGASLPTIDFSHKRFLISIDEIQQNFVFGEQFTGHYEKTVTLSDGTPRRIELTPMIHEGRQVVEFKDTGGLTYMGLNGTTTNGKLMVQLHDVDTLRAELKAEGFAEFGKQAPGGGL